MKTLGLRDIIGPIMVGPSSSHTAGALRIARMARNLCAAPPRAVTFRLLGSFAHTLSGHGTDRALVAGMLGLDADDLRIRDSFSLARKEGLAFSFEPDAKAAFEHPNTVVVRIEDAAGEQMVVRGESIGGGAAVIRSIDGIDVYITGESTSVVVRQRDERGVLAHIAKTIGDAGVNIATARLYRTRRGDTAYTVLETDQGIGAQVKAAIEAHPAIYDVRVIPGESAGEAECGTGAQGIPADADTALTRFDALDFATGSALISLCEEQEVPISQVLLTRERALAESRGERFDARAYLARALEVMREAATRPLAEPAPSLGGLIGGEAARMGALAQRGGGVCDGVLARASLYATAVLETNAAMGRIVAAPTAGSAGVIPGVLLALGETRGFTDEELARGLATAAAVGLIITRNATVAGAEGGCQAEIGSAAAMAAAAACELAGGTPAQCLDAAGNALTNMMGLVCDPIAGLVEVPCQKRNAAGAACALVSAEIALAGVGNLVGFDETVEAMYQVGRALPFELRESALGGIAAAPSACAWCAARAQ